jgi:hypothetical protein
VGAREHESILYSMSQTGRREPGLPAAGARRQNDRR